MKTVITTMMFIVITSINSFAMDWIIVPGAQADGDIICLDRDDVIKDKGIISAWIKRFREDGNYTKTLLEFDCSHGKTKVVKSVDFDKATKMTTLVDYASAWEIAVPETPAKAAASMICKKSKKINPALISMREKH